MTVEFTGVELMHIRHRCNIIVKDKQFTKEQQAILDGIVNKIEDWLEHFPEETK
jgi:hypothetical protein